MPSAVLTRQPESENGHSTSQRLRFSRGSRLLKHSSFEDVYKNGRRHFSGSMTIFYILRSANQDTVNRETGQACDPGQVGFTVGRVLGGSVERNRIKRRVREAVRLNLAELNQALADRDLVAEIVINPKKSAIKAESSVLEAEVLRAFEVIAAAKQMGPAKNSREKSLPSTGPRRLGTRVKK